MRPTIPFRILRAAYQGDGEAMIANAENIAFVDALSAAYDNLMPRRTYTGAWKVGRRRYSSFNLALWAAGEDPKYSALTYGDGPFPPRRKRGRP
jgi:hypothetical protein